MPVYTQNSILNSILNLRPVCRCSKYSKCNANIVESGPPSQGPPSHAIATCIVTVILPSVACPLLLSVGGKCTINLYLSSYQQCECHCQSRQTKKAPMECQLAGFEWFSATFIAFLCPHCQRISK